MLVLNFIKEKNMKRKIIKKNVKIIPKNYTKKMYSRKKCFIYF